MFNMRIFIKWTLDYYIPGAPKGARGAKGLRDKGERGEDGDIGLRGDFGGD
jgi:hypothetical protein